MRKFHEDDEPRLPTSLEAHLRVIESSLGAEPREGWEHVLRIFGCYSHTRYRKGGRVHLHFNEANVKDDMARFGIKWDRRLAESLVAVGEAYRVMEGEVDDAKDELVNAPLAEIGFGHHHVRGLILDQVDDLRRLRWATKALKRAARQDKPTVAEPCACGHEALTTTASARVNA